MTYDPFASKTTHTPEQIASLFGPKANAPEAMKLMRLNPALYASMKKEAAVLKLIAAPQPWQDPDYRKKFEPKVYSADELRVRNIHSQAEVSALLNGTAGKDTWASIAKEDPTRFEELRAAAVSYGLLDALPPKPTEVAPTRSPDRFPLSESYAKSFGLEPGTPVTESEFRAMVRVLAERTVREEAERAGEAKKQAADEAASETNVISERARALTDAREAARLDGTLGHG